MIRHCLPCFTRVNCWFAVCVPCRPCCAPTYWPVPLNDAWTVPVTSTAALRPPSLKVASGDTTT